MSDIKPMKPLFVYGYWKPWEENANLYDSFLEYSKDTALLKYGADAVGTYIKQASKEHVEAVNQLGNAIGRGMNVLSNQMSDINETLNFLNRNLDVQIEQQRLSNMLLKNIAELLRVPDSEKERQQCIELGIKFFVNASKDVDLFVDAMEELSKAESLMKQDYFVLHRIGCIYLYVEKYLNPEKALEYFVKAAKYASVENDGNATRLVNVLTNGFLTVNSELYNSVGQIGILVADSYEKAAFSSYVLGRFAESVNYQMKSLKFHDYPRNRFLLAKYQVRNGQINDAIENLDLCIDQEPILAIAAFKEIDLINEAEVIKLIKEKNDSVDKKINALINVWKGINSNDAADVLENLIGLSKESYEVKIAEVSKYQHVITNVQNEINLHELEIDAFIGEIKATTYVSHSADNIELIIQNLNRSKTEPLEKSKTLLQKLKLELNADKLKVGVRYAGGLVFYLDKSGKHGLVSTSDDIGNAPWGIDGKIGADGNGISDSTGKSNTNKIITLASTLIEKGFFKSTETQVSTAARLCSACRQSGFSDWYLPTVKELKVLVDNLKLVGVYWSSTEVTTGVVWTAEQQGGEMSKWFNDKMIHGHHAHAIQGERVFRKGEMLPDYPTKSLVLGRNTNCKIRAVRQF